MFIFNIIFHYFNTFFICNFASLSVKNKLKYSLVLNPTRLNIFFLLYVKQNNLFFQIFWTFNYFFKYIFLNQTKKTRIKVIQLYLILIQFLKFLIIGKLPLKLSFNSILIYDFKFITKLNEFIALLINYTTPKFIFFFYKIPFGFIKIKKYRHIKKKLRKKIKFKN